MVSACMAAKWLFGGKQRWPSDKGAARPQNTVKIQISRPRWKFAEIQKT